MIIIQDSQEKLPWDFSFFGYKQEIKSLKTADYTLKGYEDKICIERKKSTGEIAINIGMKWNAFKRELERMRSYEEKYLICEFPESNIFNFPLNSGIPYDAWPKLRISAQYLCTKLSMIQDHYGVKIFYQGTRQSATVLAVDLFEEFILKYENTKKVGN